MLKLPIVRVLEFGFYGVQGVFIRPHSAGEEFHHGVDLFNPDRGLVFYPTLVSSAYMGELSKGL